VLLYLVRLADMCDVDLGEAVMQKMAKNALK
jgi:NTP pyrophosphatase (non-canonical NTP hydrolase)